MNDELKIVKERLIAIAPDIWIKHNSSGEGFEDFSKRIVKCFDTAISESMAVEGTHLVRWSDSTPLTDALDFVCAVENIAGHITITIGGLIHEKGEWHPFRRWIIDVEEGVH